jgi:hypothetical protein
MHWDIVQFDPIELYTRGWKPKLPSSAQSAPAPSDFDLRHNQLAQKTLRNDNDRSKSVRQSVRTDLELA